MTVVKVAAALAGAAALGYILAAAVVVKHVAALVAAEDHAEQSRRMTVVTGDPAR